LSTETCSIPHMAQQVFMSAVKNYFGFCVSGFFMSDINEVSFRSYVLCYLALGPTARQKYFHWIL